MAVSIHVSNIIFIQACCMTVLSGKNHVIDIFIFVRFFKTKNPLKILKFLLLPSNQYFSFLNSTPERKKKKEEKICYHMFSYYVLELNV